MANFMNGYSLEKIEGRDKEKYYVSFTDGDGEFQRVEINFEIYTTLFELNQTDRNLTRLDERNLEHSELTDESLNRRSFRNSKSVEAIILEKEMKTTLWKSIGELPDVQRKRLLLYYDYGFTLKEIALTEKCSIRAIQYSIYLAKKKFRRKDKKVLNLDFVKRGPNVETGEGVIFSSLFLILKDRLYFEN